MTILAIGLISLLQTCFIPGYIVTRFLFKNQSPPNLIPTSLSLSLTINWMLAFYATRLGLFDAHFLKLTLIIEGLVFLFLIFKNDNYPKNRSVKTVHLFDSHYQAISFVVVFAAFLITLSKLGHVFTDADGVRSWNRWALVWAENRMPTDTFHYPQLIPANYAISYVLTGLPKLQIFSFAIAVFFFPFACLSLYSVAEKLKSPELHLANVFFFGVMLLSGNLANGWVDVPVACMAVFSMSLFMLGWGEELFLFCGSGNLSVKSLHYRRQQSIWIGCISCHAPG